MSVGTYLRAEGLDEERKVTKLRHTATPAPPPRRFEPTPEPLVLQKGEIKRGRVA